MSSPEPRILDQRRITMAVSPGSFGALVALPPDSKSVGVGSSEVVAANPIRTGLTLINISANNISFGIGTPAVLSSGITLTPNGVWEMDSFTFSVGAINAIASGAGSTLSIQEYTS